MKVVISSLGGIKMYPPRKLGEERDCPEWGEDSGLTVDTRKFNRLRRDNASTVYHRDGTMAIKDEDGNYATYNDIGHNLDE